MRYIAFVDFFMYIKVNVSRHVNMSLECKRIEKGD